MIIVQLPNGSKINVENLPEDTPAEQVLKVVRAHAAAPNRAALAIDQVDGQDGSEDRDQAGNRVIKLKTNAQTKG
jgi:hypothetical protein